jgi:hypothetical protein
LKKENPPSVAKTYRRVLQTPFTEVKSIMSNEWLECMIFAANCIEILLHHYYGWLEHAVLDWVLAQLNRMVQSASADKPPKQEEDKRD